MLYNIGGAGSLFPDAPFYDQVLLSGQFGTLLPPSTKVAAFVRSTGPQDADPPQLRDRMLTTLNEACKYVRSGMDDTIVVLPGHTESSTSTDILSNIKAGTRIIGVGRGSMQPTLRWTGTTAQLLIDVADVWISGMFFRMEGANGVAKAISITGEDCHLVGNRIQVASATDLHALIAVEVGTGAHRARINGNKFYGIVGEPITDGVHVAAAVDDVEVCGNVMHFAGAADATGGMIRVSAAALRMLIAKNTMYNAVASGDYAVVLGNVACQGTASQNHITVLDSGAVPASRGFSVGASSLFGFHENRVTTVVSASGIVSPAADA